MNAEDELLSLPDILSPAELLQMMSLLRESRRIVITAHHGPDGDAVGSALAWGAYLKKIGKKVSICLPSWYPDFLRWMPGSQDIITYYDNASAIRQLLAEADLVCCLDLNNLSRLNQMEEAVAATKAPRILIDHHVEPQTEQFKLVVSRPDMSSTCELVFRIIWQLGGYEHMSRSTAACLYTGIMTDTGNFSYSSNDPLLFLSVSLIMRKNIDKESIYKKIYHSWSQGKFTLWNDTLSQCLSFHASGHASVFTLTREQMKAHKFLRGDAEGLVNEPLKVRGMKLSISLREDTEENVVRVSLRSTAGFHCREMAERFFNGGGHEDAAGGKLPFPIEEARNTAIKAIEAYETQLINKPSPS